MTIDVRAALVEALETNDYTFTIRNIADVLTPTVRSLISEARAQGDRDAATDSGTEGQIVRVLRDHADRGVIDGWAYCKCGWFVREHTADAHRRHLARELAAAGLVKR